MNYLSGLIMSGKDSNIFADIQKGIVYLLKDNEIFTRVTKFRFNKITMNCKLWKNYLIIE